MRWPTIGSIVDDWKESREEWRPWFAWRPVLLTSYETADLKSRWCWWENIERKISTTRSYSREWIYRVPPTEENE
jgi:hypothetical protein